MMKIYISGPITGTEDYVQRFYFAEGSLCALSEDEVVNPVKLDSILPKSLTCEERLKINLALIDVCDAIYMLDDWEDSCDANRELGYAMGKGKQVMYE